MTTAAEKEQTKDIQGSFVTELSIINNSVRDMLAIVRAMPAHLGRQQFALAARVKTIQDTLGSMLDIVKGMDTPPAERGVMFHARRNRSAALTVCGVAPQGPDHTSTTVAHFRSIHADPNRNWCQECSAVILGEGEG